MYYICKSSHLKIWLKALLIIVCFSIILSCKDSDIKKNIANKVDLSDVAIEVTMEGKTFGIKQKKLEPIKKTLFKSDSIQLIFWEDDNPLKLNFNLNNTDILNKGSATMLSQMLIQVR